MLACCFGSQAAKASLRFLTCRFLLRKESSFPLLGLLDAARRRSFGAWRDLFALRMERLPSAESLMRLRNGLEELCFSSTTSSPGAPLPTTLRLDLKRLEFLLRSGTKSLPTTLTRWDLRVLNMHIRRNFLEACSNVWQLRAPLPRVHTFFLWMSRSVRLMRTRAASCAVFFLNFWRKSRAPLFS